MLDEMLQKNASKFVIFYVLTYIQNEKKYGFSYAQTITNFKAFHKNISLSSNLLLQKSEIYIRHFTFIEFRSNIFFLSNSGRLKSGKN